MSATRAGARAWARVRWLGLGLWVRDGLGLKISGPFTPKTDPYKLGFSSCNQIHAKGSIINSISPK